MGVIICCFLLDTSTLHFIHHLGSNGCFLELGWSQRMAQMGREVTCLGFGSSPIAQIHFMTGLCSSSNMIALMCCLWCLGFCFHNVVLGFRNHFGCTCSHRFGKCWEVAWVRVERHVARGDADVTKTGFRHDFHAVQLADFNDAAQSFCFQHVQGYAVPNHDDDAGATFAVDFDKFRN